MSSNRASGFLVSKSVCRSGSQGAMKQGVLNGMGLCTRLRAIAIAILLLCSLGVADDSWPEAAVKAPKEFNAISILRVVDPTLPGWEAASAWNEFRHMVSEAPSKGIDRLQVDFWWRLLQPAGADSWEPAYYDKILDIVEEENAKHIKAGRKPLLIDGKICRHQLGGNQGDGDAVILLPDHILEEMRPNSEHGDLAYVSEAVYRDGKLVGFRNEEALSPQAGKYLRHHTRNLFQRVNDHFGKRKGLIAKWIIGMKAAGEMLYPAYHLPVRSADIAHAFFPNRGVFHMGSEEAQKMLRADLREKYAGDLVKLNLAWELPPEKAFTSWDEVSALQTQDEVDVMLRDHGQYSQQGQDVLGHYHRVMADDCFADMEVAEQVFHSPASVFADTPLAAQVPGVHWGFVHRLPMLTAGLLSTEGASPSPSLPIHEMQPKDWKQERGAGLTSLFERTFVRMRTKYPQSKWYFIYTCAELPSCAHDCLLRGVADAGCHCKLKECDVHSFSGAGHLTRAMAHLGAEHRIPGLIENALNESIHWPNPIAELERALGHEWIVGLYFLRAPDFLHSKHAQDLVARWRAGEARAAEAAAACADRLLVLEEPAPVSES